MSATVNRSRVAIVAGLLLAGLSRAALLWETNQGNTVELVTISCPVYQAPATPMPEWPTVCGGQRAVSTLQVNLPALAPSLVVAALAMALLWYGLATRWGHNNAARSAE